VQSIDDALFPHGKPSKKRDREQLIDLYKIMVQSSEDLVSRRQAVNTFFVSVHGVLLTAGGLLIGSSLDGYFRSFGLLALAATGITLSLAWRSRIASFGQLNTGKFAVITRIEAELAASIFDAEWVALGKGRDPKKYRTFTSREVWVPWTFFSVYIFFALLAFAFSAWLFVTGEPVIPLPSPSPTESR
jgi:hypothetical protein